MNIIGKTVINNKSNKEGIVLGMLACNNFPIFVVLLEDNKIENFFTHDCRLKRDNNVIKKKPKPELGHAGFFN